MNSEDEHDQCESDVDGFPVGSPHSPVLEDPDCDGCREEFGAPSNCTYCPYRDHPKAKPIPPPVKKTGSFCPYCGHDVDWSKPTAPLSIALPCDHEGPDDAKFCPDCGVAIEYDCEGEAKGRVLVPAGHSDCKVCNPPAEEIPIPDIKRKRCDFHEILHPNDIECPLCDGTAITCTCGLILFWDDAREHFKVFRNHPYQIHVPVATKEREKEES